MSDPLLVRALRREQVERTPVWFMRQAGRYMPEYRAIKERATFLEMCKTPELAAQVTLQPIDRFPLDAAIIFADILLPLEPMGLRLEFAAGEGPVIHNPVRDRAAVDQLKVIDGDELDYVAEAIRQARRAIDELGKRGEISLVYAGGIRNGGDVAKAMALGADAVAIGHSVLMALNCNKEIPESDFENEIGVPAGYCYHCHTGRCPVGITTQDPELRKRLDPDEAAERVYNFLHTLTLEAQMLARACGKTSVHSLEPEDLAALTMEASAMAQVPLAGTDYTVGVDNYHKIG